VTLPDRAATHLLQTRCGRAAAGVWFGGQSRMDVLERLADVSVPPVPAAGNLAAGMRRKLHPRLLALHVAEFAVGATAWAARHMLIALFAAVVYTVSGRWPQSAKRMPPNRA